MTDATRALTDYQARMELRSQAERAGSASEVLAMLVNDIETFGDAKVQAAVEQTLEIAGRPAAE